MHANDGRVAFNFIVQALKGEDIAIDGDGMQSGAGWTTRLTTSPAL